MDIPIEVLHSDSQTWIISFVEDLYFCCYVTIHLKELWCIEYSLPNVRDQEGLGLTKDLERLNYLNCCKTVLQKVSYNRTECELIRSEIKESLQEWFLFPFENLVFSIFLNTILTPDFKKNFNPMTPFVKLTLLYILNLHGLILFFQHFTVKAFLFFNSQPNVNFKKNDLNKCSRTAWKEDELWHLLLKIFPTQNLIRRIFLLLHLLVSVVGNLSHNCQ